MHPVSNGAYYTADTFYPVPGSDGDLFIQYPSGARASQDNSTTGDSWVRVYRHSERRFTGRRSVSLDSDATPIFAERGDTFVVRAHLSGYSVVRIGGNGSLTITKSGTNPRDPFRPARSLGSTGDLGMLAAQSWHSGGQAAQVSVYFPGEDRVATEMLTIPNAVSVHGVHLSSNGRFMAVEAAFAPAGGTRARLLIYDIGAHPRVTAYLERRARGE
ncbi:MAG: hypothetical protein AAGH64_00655 [Planctomycetota bacterium]